MSSKNRERKPTRHADYDYSIPWWYFITICADNHNKLFGEVLNDEMTPNDIGKIAHDCWKQIPDHFQKVELDHYVIMPNHIHGIIIINNVGDADLASPKLKIASRKQTLREQTIEIRELNKQGNSRDNAPGDAEFASPTEDRTKMTLSKVIQQFKRQVTYDARLKYNFQGKLWQRSFYDRIIRNERELNDIRRYIHPVR
ncbi:MAG: transposase [Bacteroidetes bacterium]|nr:transposase [Bacteroidota bacterium]